MRDEACPVCGETDAWDGGECSVCGYVAPPSKFQDPDVDMHKNLDLRQDQAPGGGDVSDLNADVNDLDRDGLDDDTGQPIGQENEMGADDQQPMLTCPNCGYEEPAAEPESVDTADGNPQVDQAMGEQDPDSLNDQAEMGSSAAGEPCPNCGEAPLMTPDEMAEAGLGEQQPTDDPDDVAPEGNAEHSDVEDPDDQDDSPFPSKDDDGDDDPDDSDDQKSPFGKKDDDDSDDDSEDDDSDDSDDDDEKKKPAKNGFPPAKR